jgi:hypothetical protein
MNHELNRQIFEFLGTDLAFKCYSIAAGVPVSFAAIWKEHTICEIEDAILEKRSDAYIARKFNINKRTVRRYRKSLAKRK